jgi:hypothetical protein
METIRQHQPIAIPAIKQILQQLQILTMLFQECPLHARPAIQQHRAGNLLILTMEHSLSPLDIPQSHVQIAIKMEIILQHQLIAIHVTSRITSQQQIQITPLQVSQLLARPVTRQILDGNQLHLIILLFRLPWGIHQRHVLIATKMVIIPQ